MVNIMKNDSSLQSPNTLVVPSTCCAFGLPELQGVNFMQTFQDQIKFVSIEQWAFSTGLSLAIISRPVSAVSGTVVFSQIFG